MVRFRRKHGVLPWKESTSDMFSIETTLDQSIQALNLASAKAARDGDSENLTAAAHGWMRLTETIHTISLVAKQEQEKADGMPDPAATGFGFRAPEYPAPLGINEDEPLAER